MCYKVEGVARSMVQRVFSFSKKIEALLGQQIPGGEVISFSSSDLRVIFDNWETLTAAQQTAITVVMNNLNLAVEE